MIQADLPPNVRRKLETLRQALDSRSSVAEARGLGTAVLLQEVDIHARYCIQLCEILRDYGISDGDIAEANAIISECEDLIECGKTVSMQNDSASTNNAPDDNKVLR